MIPFVSHMPVYACSFPGAMTATWPHLRFDWWHARKTDARTRTSPSGSPRWLRMGWNWPKLRNMFWTCLERIGDMPGISPRANAKGTRERSWKHSSLIDPSWNLPEPPKARAGTRSHTGLRPLCQMLLGNENFLRYIVLRCLCSNSSVLVMHPVFGCPTLWQRPRLPSATIPANLTSDSCPCQEPLLPDSGDCLCASENFMSQTYCHGYHGWGMVPLTGIQRVNPGSRWCQKITEDSLARRTLATWNCLLRCCSLTKGPIM